MKNIDFKSLIKSDKGRSLVLNLPCSEDERLFFNGYQSWTTSKELVPTDVMLGAHKLPSFVVNHWGIDRYGDYHFMDYSEQPGVFHGFSYCYRRSGDQYLLIGSTDESDGYTIFEYDASKEELVIRKDSENDVHIFIAEGYEDEVFDGWFKAMKVKPRPAKPLTGYSSWYNRYEKISERTIMEDLAGCENVLAEGDLFQIDDGWEAAIGDWSAHPGKFPGGMKKCADEIHAKGYLAGLWLAPFVVGAKSKLIKEHPDWLLQHDGKPWFCGCNWGGFYSLDIDNEEVQTYLEKVFDRVFNEWGYDLVKLDFLYAAAPWPNEETGESRGERMCRAVDMLRYFCKDKLILGCGVPLWPAFGVFDYCRIGCDVGLDWNNSWIMQRTNNERVSTKNSIANTYYRRELNGRAFLNDPDVFFLRNNNIKLNNDKKILLARVNAQYGGILLTSDNMGTYDSNQIKTYNELRELWRDKSWTDLDFLKDLN